MEQSAEEKKNHQIIVRIPLPKSSLTRINRIYIDLTDAMDDQQNTRKCEHFSIRGYVADMRKNDISVCVPLSTNEEQNKAEEKNSTILPPMEVMKFKKWTCHNCLREMGSACCAQDFGKLTDSLPSKFVSKNLCSTKKNLNNVPIIESAPACTESNKDEILILSPGNDTEKKDNAGKSIADGSENDSNHQLLAAAKDQINSKPPLVPETYAADSVVIGKKIRGNLNICEPSIEDHISTKFTPLKNNRSSSIDIGRTGTSSSPKDALEGSISGKMDLGGPSYKGQISSNITPLEPIRSSYKDIGRTETSNPPKYHLRMETGNCEVEKIDVIKVRTNKSLSLDGSSSESSSGIAKNDGIEGSSKSIREPEPKLRLMTEILGSSGNVENDQSKISDSDFESASDFCDDMAEERKRKINQFENGKLPLTSPKKLQLSKGKGTSSVKRKYTVIDSETEESSGTFTQQKNLKKHVSPNKKKHKQTQQEGLHPISMLCPENGKTYHFAATEEGVSRPAQMNPSYTSSKSLLPAEEKFSMIKNKNKPLIIPPVPQWSTMLGEGSFIGKDSNSYGRKGVDCSLNSYEATQRNRESHIVKATIEPEPSYRLRDDTGKERYYQLKDGLFHSGESTTLRKNAPNPDSGKVFLYDLNEKIATQSPIRDTQNAIPRFGKETVQHHRELNISGNLVSEPKNNDQSKGDDGYPMDVVELMAKHQYERRRDEYETRREEYERNLFLQERNNGKRKFESMGATRIHGNGLLKSYPVEHHNTRKQIFQTNTVKLSDQLAPMGINEARANMSKLEGEKSAFVRCNSLSNNQGTRDGRVNYPGYVSIGNGNYQNKQWRNDNTGSSFSPPEARYSIFANNTNFSQNYTPPASKFAFNSQVPEGSSNGKMAKGIDLNFLSENFRSFEKQNRVFGVESLGKSADPKFANENYSNLAKKNTDFSVRSHGKSADLNIVNEKYSYFGKNRDVGVDSLQQSSGLNSANGKYTTFEKNKYFGVDTHQKSSVLDPFALRNRGIDLNAKVSGSINLNSNETIPAMQLLGLMDAGKRSNSLLNSDGKLKITSKKPLSSCDYPPKVLEKPLFIADHGPKQLFGRDFGVSSSRPSSSKVLDKVVYISDGHSEEPFRRGFGLFSSKASSSKVLDKPTLISDDHFKGPFGRDIGVGNNILRPSSSTLFGPFSSSFPSESNPKEGNGVPIQVLSKSEEKNKGQAKNSANKLQKRTAYKTGASQGIENSVSVPNGQNTSRNEFCDVNRNPADFSFAEPENEFTISGRDLKFNQTMSLKGKQGSGNRDGKKKQKIEVHTVPKPQ